MSGVNLTSTPDKAPLRSWLPTMIVLAAIWGCSFLFIAVGVRELHPAYLTLGRVATGMVTLLVILLVRGERLPRSRRLWGHFFVLGTVGAALPFTLFGYGEQRIPSLLAGIWNGTTPLVVLPIAVLVFKTERFSAQRAIGLLIGFAGMLVVLGAWNTGGAALSGQLMCFAASACYGVAIAYQKKFLAGTSVSGLALSTGFVTGATAVLAVLAPLLARSLPPAPWDLSPKAFASVIALGMLGSGLAFVMNLRNIRLVGASTAAMVTYLIPIFAIVVGIVVLHERLLWYQPVGALVVLTGVAVSQGVFRRRPAVPRPSLKNPLPDPVR
jgi:drug/metabolite transporter (DMT)-like permease